MWCETTTHHQRNQALSTDRSCQRAVNDAAIGRYRGKGGDEQSLLRSMLDTLKRGDFCQGTATNHSTDPSILLVLIAQQRVGKRPGRVEPRALKRRPKPYPLLKLPRQSARQKVLDHGHPKNVK